MRPGLARGWAFDFAGLGDAAVPAELGAEKDVAEAARFASIRRAVALLTTFPDEPKGVCAAMVVTSTATAGR